MKLGDIFALFSLSVIVKGTWLTAAIQPFILSLGAIYTAIDQDVLSMDFLKNQVPFITKATGFESLNADDFNKREEEELKKIKEKSKIREPHIKELEEKMRE